MISKHLTNFKDFTINENISNDLINKLMEYNIENYIINNDGSIDVDGDVILRIDDRIDKIPFKFNSISGTFELRSDTVDTLIGSPRKCKQFNIINKSLKSLEGAPDECDVFYISSIMLDNIKYLPNVVEKLYIYDTDIRDLGGSKISTKNIYLHDNERLESIIGLPNNMYNFTCSNSKLASLNGSPKECVEFNVINNKLTSLKGAPIIVSNMFSVYNNELTSLKGIDYDHVNHFHVGRNKLTTLKYSPKSCISFSCEYNPLKSYEFGPNSKYIDISNTYISSFNFMPDTFSARLNDKLKCFSKFVTFGGTRELNETSFININVEYFNFCNIIDDSDLDNPVVNLKKLKSYLNDVKIDINNTDIFNIEKYYTIK